ncbi:trehalose-phosphatase [Halomarina halobia]|uniref:Trehalose 6-phosphate phosphatase n=1 Tax=Halomarina halobia TaxID=3033386 RepID=A0ABD6A5J9_9EURY|nr:trehalose-phosphatase [Halomarina sp. PSR21]
MTTDEWLSAGESRSASDPESESEAEAESGAGVPSLWSISDAVADRLADAEGLLVCLDFDGTLAPIVPRPEEAAIPAATRKRIRALNALDGVQVAVVSGRALTDVRERVGLDGLVYAGNHGLELERGGDLTVHPLASASRPALRRACRAIHARLGTIPGCRVEDKGVTATVHYRDAADAAVPAIEEVVSTVAGAESLRVTDGKAVFEIRPRIPWGKGRIVSLLAAEVGGGWLPIYVGDDTSDEDAFGVLADGVGIGVVVGSPSATAAAARLDDPDDVATFVGWLTARWADRPVEVIDAEGKRP